VKSVVRRWEEHTVDDAWWRRRHRVHYIVELDPVRSKTPKASADARAHRTSNGVDDGAQYEIYWNRGASGQREEWVLLKKLDGEGISI
jgi:hypothetical protein